MDLVVVDDVVRFSLGSYLILVETMNANDLCKETLIFYKQLHGAGLLSREAEDKSYRASLVGPDEPDVLT
jgi:hypothetical protein